MQESFLVQRLRRPKKITGPLSKAHRVFGGGMLGLSEAQWDFVDEVFEIDYMGKAEFEFGEFPRAMKKLIDEKERVAFLFSIERCQIRPNPARKPVRKKDRKKSGHPSDPATIYVVCASSQREHVEQNIRKLAAGQLNPCRDIFLDRALDPLTEYDNGVVGWFDLRNAFFFFSDKVMWQGVAAWFELEANG